MAMVVHWLPGGGRRLEGDGEDAVESLDTVDGNLERITRSTDGNLERITRSADGRFVVRKRDSLASDSDDGGFLAWRRRPLVAQTSRLSLRSDGTGQSNLAVLYTPRLVASSPSHSHTPLYNFSDMSSVPAPGSAELQLRSVHERYSQELPSLRAIHSGRFFVPVQPPRPAGLLMETSPESRSSSSGFGSKNTSSQQNQSSQSGSTTLTQPRIYIPPHITPPPPLGDWLDLTPTVAEVSPASVDIHYEFDAVFPSTPTPPMTTYPAYSTQPRAIKRTRYDNIEARVAAMKAEFHQFRLRQEKRRRSEELESVC